MRGKEAGVIASFALLGPAVTENRGWTSYHARQCVSIFCSFYQMDPNEHVCDSKIFNRWRGTVGKVSGLTSQVLGLGPMRLLSSWGWDLSPLPRLCARGSAFHEDQTG